jgi:hypothetical protein
MGLSAIVPRARCIGRLRIPFDDSQGRVSALNHKPVLGIGGFPPADFTTEFSYRCHSLLLYGYSEEDECDSALSRPLDPESTNRGEFENRFLHGIGTCIIPKCKKYTGAQ